MTETDLERRVGAIEKDMRRIWEKLDTMGTESAKRGTCLARIAAASEATAGRLERMEATLGKIAEKQGADGVSIATIMGSRKALMWGVVIMLSLLGLLVSMGVLQFPAPQWPDGMPPGSVP
jgi:hypothetical protein